MRTLLIILIVTLQLFILPLIWIIDDSKADEDPLPGDADNKDIVLTLDEQAMIDRVLLKYEWDESYQGSTTIETTMTAHVE